MLSKQLATILLDCPVQFHEEDYKLTAPDFQKVTDVFQELEFRRSLDTVNKLFKQPVAVEEVPAEKKTAVKAVSTPSSLDTQLDLFAVPAEEEVHTGYHTLKSTSNVYQFVKYIYSKKIVAKEFAKTRVRFYCSRDY